MPPFNPLSVPDLTGKVYLVTGGNAGIGRETILHLVHKNATVYMGCRSPTKGSAAIESILELVPTATIHLLILDHMDLSSIVFAVKEFTSKESKLHGLINNAGIMAVPQETSKDGWESQWQTNYLSHYLLTHLLLPTILATAKVSRPGEVRIVNVTSMGHKMLAPKVGIDFEDLNQVKGSLWSRYGQSKLANILHAKQLNALYGPNGTNKHEGEIWTAAVHPGNIYTDLNRNARFLGLGVGLSSAVASMLNCFGAYIPADQGGYTSVFCVASESMKADASGQYFVPLGKTGKPSENAQDMEMAKKLWAWTENEFRGSGLL
jgi:NAD(P)-dependent dehydrogenase (short-subunit alcohol dehydrogenase family)